MEGRVDYYDLTLVLSTLIHFDPFQAIGSGELGFLWIAEILSSGYQEDQCERLAREVVKLLGRHFFRESSVSFIDVQSAWIPPLLGFLSLSQIFDSAGSTRFIALRILATSPGYTDFGPMILPIVTSSLLPTRPLQACRLALNIFLRFKSGWFSSRMENVPSKDLDGLVRAVADPFRFPRLPLQDGKPAYPADYDPTMVIAVLIEFAPLGLWRNHLRRSNFTSFEKMVSTSDDKRIALGCMIGMATKTLPEFLCTATKITAAIRRFEELQCSNTVEVVIMWAWTVGVVNPVDHDGWQLIGRDTLRFYQPHGTERPTFALKRHITGMLVNVNHFMFFMRRIHGASHSGRDFVELPVLGLHLGFRYQTYLYLSQACQLRRLYQLFGYDPTTWEEAVVADEVGEKMHVSSGRPVALVSFVDWACDYP